jgi:hypothetical protein
MTALVKIIDVAITGGDLAVLIIVARRPERRWRKGWAGKLLSLAAVLFVTFHLGAVSSPSAPSSRSPVIGRISRTAARYPWRTAGRGLTCGKAVVSSWCRTGLGASRALRFALRPYGRPCGPP